MLFDRLGMIISNVRDDCVFIMDLLHSRIARIVESRDALVCVIHLRTKTWSIERKIIANRISESTRIPRDISEIVADYIGSAHGRAIDLVHNSHKHIFTSKFASVATRKELISTDELFDNFKQQLKILGYQSVTTTHSMQSAILDLLKKIIVEHNNGASAQYITDMFYHVILLTWPDYMSKVDTK